MPHAQRIDVEPEYLRTKQFMTSGYSDRRVAFIRSKVKLQSSWLLHLAGDRFSVVTYACARIASFALLHCTKDHHQNFETKLLLHGQYMMRCMLTANLAVDRACLRFVDNSAVAVAQERAKEQSNKKQDQRFANGAQA